jgi:hypothetical protein
MTLFPPLALASAALMARGLFLGYPDKVVPDGRLTKKEQAVVAACANAFFPPDGPIAVSGSDARLVLYMERYLARLPAGQARLVRLLFWFIEHGPWVFGPTRQRFSDLPHGDRLAVLESMRTSPIYFRRIAFLSMRTMLTMGYLADPRVAAAMRMRADQNPFGLEEKS